MSNAAWRTRKRVAALSTAPAQGRLGAYVPVSGVLDIIDDELEREAEQQFTRPISQQAEQSKMLKEDK